MSRFIGVLCLLPAFAWLGCVAPPPPPALTLSEPADEEADVEISISIDDGVSLNGRRMEIAELESAFSGYAEPGELLVVVVAEREAPHQTVVAVMDQVRAAGVQKIKIAVRD